MDNNNKLTLINQGYCNAMAKYYYAKNGDKYLYSVSCFNRDVYNPLNIENHINFNRNKKEKIDALADDLFYQYSALLKGNIYEYDIKELYLKCHDSAEARILYKPKKDTSEKSRLRALNKCRDYLFSNPDLDLMITLTISPEQIDRYNYNDIMKKVSVWLSNRVKRNNLKYVIVPEKHEDGAIHFHGFVNSSAVKLKATKYKRSYDGKNFIFALEPTRKGKRIYNIVDWDIGYTTAVRLGKKEIDRTKSAEYCLKYITKQNKKIGGRWYLHSTNCTLPFEVYFCYDFNSVPCDAIKIDSALELKKITQNTNLTFLGLLNHEIRIFAENGL